MSVINIEDKRRDKNDLEFKIIVDKLESLLQTLRTYEPPKEISAILTSRDGLTRMIRIQYPAPTLYRVPLKNMRVSIEDPFPLIQTRFYRIVGYQNGFDGQPMAVYEERE